MGLLNVARVPAVTVEPFASVKRGMLLMQEENVGALFVVENDKLLGAFTERDFAFRVALRRRGLETTLIRDVMTSPAWSLSAQASVDFAIDVMVARHVRHLPIMSDGKVKGMVSLRHMLRERVQDLTEELDFIVAKTCADGIGG